MSISKVKQITVGLLLGGSLFMGVNFNIAHADTTSNNSQVQTNNNNNNNTNNNNNDDSDNSSVEIKLDNNKHVNEVTNFKALTHVAKAHLGLRYIYGGTTTRGFDCSGFTKYVYQKALHIQLPRTAQAQYDGGTPISEANAKKGDLVFFGSSKNSIDHVGLYLGHGKMIDSQNRGVVVEHVHAPWWHLAGFASYTD